MAHDTCIFCQIITGESPAEIIYQDEEMTAFRDQFPAAPIHILIVPNRHIDSLNTAVEEDAELLGRLLLKAKEIADMQGVRKKGYRLLINVERGGGQSVFHLHVHLIAGPHKLSIRT